MRREAKLNIKDFLALPRACILVVSDEGSRATWVNYTTNTALTMARLYDELAGQTLSLRIVSTDTDLETLKLHCQYYRNYYHSVLGCPELIEYGRESIRYQVRVRPQADLRTVLVEVVTVRGKAKVVGVFKNSKIAHDFMETYYGANNPFNLPVYAANSATKEFMLDNKTKLLDVR